MLRTPIQATALRLCVCPHYVLLIIKVLFHLLLYTLLDYISL
jgi:hypothetical protein